MNDFTRREFLASSARFLAAAGTLSALPAAEKEEKPKLAVAIRDTHLRETGEKDCWAILKELGVDGVELDVSDDFSLASLIHPEQKYSIADDAAVEKLAADSRAANIRITALCLHNRFDERLDFELNSIEKTARAAKALGAKTIRIDVVPRKLSGEEFINLAIDAGKKLIAVTETTGVCLGVENHGNTTNDPEFLKKLFAGVGSQRLGLTLDTGNFYWFGHPLSKLYELYEAFATRVHHTHVKSIKYPQASREKRRSMGWEYEKYNCPIYEGDIDFSRVIGILRKGGYSGDLCIEDESLSKAPAAQRREILAKEVQHLKALA